MIRDFTDNDFDRVFEIIEESFPRDEHGTYEEHKKLLADPNYKIYILEDDETGVIKGFMSVWDLGDKAHIDHFAIAFARQRRLEQKRKTPLMGFFRYYLPFR